MSDTRALSTYPIYPMPYPINLWQNRKRFNDMSKKLFGWYFQIEDQRVLEVLGEIIVLYFQC